MSMKDSVKDSAKSLYMISLFRYFFLRIEGFLRLAAEGFSIFQYNMSRFLAVIFHIAFKLNVGGIGYYL